MVFFIAYKLKIHIFFVALVKHIAHHQNDGTYLYNDNSSQLYFLYGFPHRSIFQIYE